ncbi:hypothetical protein [Absidia glauca]|uniref:C3H1-type domain-containing protein n=1 Tax=Absidia glauca TaxID=4829 RepID=A0A168STM5_ABSGL|nr:hypothetical protein [Absidia glauca]
MNFWDQPGWEQLYQHGPGQQQQQPNHPSNNTGQQHNTLATLQHQTHQRQAQGALAAASLTSFLATPSPQPSYPSDTWAMSYQRGVVPYDDISTATTQAPPKPAEEDGPGGSCCFRYYKTAKALEQHRSGHVACTECSDFVGIRQLLQDHLETIHGAPKKNKKSIPDGVVPANAPRLDTPEAIAAWIQERKKNWPINYADSDSGDDTMDLQADAISSKDPTTLGKRPPPPTTRPKKLCRYFMRGKCKREDECHFSHEKPKQTPQKGKPLPVDAFRKRPHLLKMLLAKEIRQEQNVILQCLRYIKDNDFFGVGAETS